VSEPSVTDNAAAHRFEARVDGRLAGFAEYQLTDELMVFTHTEVEPAFEGQGVGSAIARFALDQLRADGKLKVWIERHPDYLDLTYGARPSRAD